VAGFELYLISQAAMVEVLMERCLGRTVRLRASRDRRCRGSKKTNKTTLSR